MIKKSIKQHNFVIKPPYFVSPGVYTREVDTNVVVGFRPLPFAYEPMRQLRYVLSIDPANGGEVAQFFVRMDEGPRIRSNYEEIPFMSTSTWVRPHISWDPIKFKIIDTIGPTSIDIFRDWMHSYSEGVVRGHRTDYKRNVTLEKVDPVGTVIEKWQLLGSMIQELNHEVVYDQTYNDIEVTIGFDRAILIQ